MAVYKNTKQNSGLTALESVSAPDGQQFFFHIRDAAAGETIKQSLQHSGISLKWVAQSKLDTGLVLIAHGARGCEAQTVAALTSTGENLELSHKQKKIDPWVIRSFLGFGGQTLQLTSSFMRPDKPGMAGKGIWHKVDMPIFVFAAANMTANVINLAYKAQNVDDPKQLRYLKQRVNEALSPALEPGHYAPSVDDKRSDLREKPHEATGPLASFNAFMRKYSVNVGELGLRYLGAFGLISPMNTWGNVFKGKLPELGKSPYRNVGGFSSLAGKTIALGSTIPDPYDTKPRSWLDNIREKYSFLTGGLIEAGAFSVLAYDNFVNTKPISKTEANPRGIMFKGRAYRDWLGGIGAAMFVTGYLVRSWAKYGTRHVDMNELYAHVSDTLAQLPPDKVPQLLADTAADIKNHFKGSEELDYGTIYAALANDLKRYHHIDVTADVRQQLQPAPEKANNHNTKQQIGNIAQPSTKIRSGSVVEPLSMAAPEMALNSLTR